MQMQPNMEIFGYASLKTRVTCAQDLIDLGELLKSAKVDPSAEVDSDAGHVYVTLADGNGGLLIECGEHIPATADGPADVLLPAHECVYWNEDDDDDDEPIICASCGISDQHDDFGPVATLVYNYAKNTSEFMCGVCADEREAEKEDRLDRLREVFVRLDDQKREWRGPGYR